jgi:probable phosphoglycerate mutase
MSQGNEGPILWLVRHGETEWSRTGQHTGRSDLPLTDKGREQAERLHPLLAPLRFAAVVTSPRQRARETCALAGCGHRPDAAAVVDEDLAEWDYGEYEGITSAQIHSRAPEWSLWRDGCPGGESPEAICARVDRLIDRWGARAGNVALFGHGHVLRLVALRWLAWPLEQGAQLALDTATVGALGYAGGRRSLLVWNRPTY